MITQDSITALNDVLFDMRRDVDARGVMLTPDRTLTAQENARFDVYRERLTAIIPAWISFRLWFDMPGAILRFEVSLGETRAPRPDWRVE
jgi:hypothetical protein